MPDESRVGRGQDAQTQSRHAETLGDALHDGHVGIGFEHVVVQEGVFAVVDAEVDKRLIDHEADVALLAPFGQPEDFGRSEEVA